MTIKFPYSVKTIGTNLEEIEFIGDKEESRISMEVCILDATHNILADGRWSSTHFERVLDGISSITFEPSQFILVAFVRHTHIRALERALAIKGVHYEI